MKIVKSDENSNRCLVRNNKSYSSFSTINASDSRPYINKTIANYITQRWNNTPKTANNSNNDMMQDKKIHTDHKIENITKKKKKSDYVPQTPVNNIYSSKNQSMSMKEATKSLNKFRKVNKVNYDNELHNLKNENSQLKESIVSYELRIKWLQEKWKELQECQKIAINMNEILKEENGQGKTQ